MARVSSTAASTLGSGVTTPSIQNISVTAALEAPVALPASTRRYKVQMRDSSGFEVRYVSAGPHFTIECGNDYEETGLSPTISYTIIVTPSVSGTLEVISWS